MTQPYFPLRINFTHEDKAAKGLRSLREPQQAPDEPVYFTAREAVDMYPRLLLLGERGSGKSTFAQALAAETGMPLIEITSQSGQIFIPQNGAVIIDSIDRLTREAFHDLISALGDRAVLLLGDSAFVKGWSLPSDVAVHTLMPLTTNERRAYLDGNGIAAPAALSIEAGNPALFALASTLAAPAATAEDIVDLAFPPDADVERHALDRLREGVSSNRTIDGLLAARQLARLEPRQIVDLHRAAPILWAPSISSHFRRQPDAGERLASLLLSGDTDAAMLGALIVAETGPDDPAVVASLTKLIDAGRLTPEDRNRAARILSLNGDPRDLEALCAIPGGTFTMGSHTHPNSSPVHEVSVPPFRIGKFPVTNGLYARFVKATERKWVSPDLNTPQNRNAPATDLTWHDARAYCDWLTAEWRRLGRIGTDEIIRLPTEPEWERASRGDQSDCADAVVYPWGLGWNRDAANSEETGFNAPSAVGLFPAGQSPYGCLDMAGQVWEWTTTLWGDDMTAPTFAYPYRQDGREDADAGPSIRRVLRGGCFSSTSLKACCTYRGSLEPDGFWRGNGFRIVVWKPSMRA